MLAEDYRNVCKKTTQTLNNCMVMILLKILKRPRQLTPAVNLNLQRNFKYYQRLLQDVQPQIIKAQIFSTLRAGKRTFNNDPLTQYFPARERQIAIRSAAT